MRQPALGIVCIKTFLLRGASKISISVVISISSVWWIYERLLIVVCGGVHIPYQDNKEDKEDGDGKLEDITYYTTLVKHPVLVEESTELSHSIDYKIDLF